MHAHGGIWHCSSWSWPPPPPAKQAINQLKSKANPDDAAAITLHPSQAKPMLAALHACPVHVACPTSDPIGALGGASCSSESETLRIITHVCLVELAMLLLLTCCSVVQDMIRLYSPLGLFVTPEIFRKNSVSCYSQIFRRQSPLRSKFKQDFFKHLDRFILRAPHAHPMLLLAKLKLGTKRSPSCIISTRQSLPNLARFRAMITAGQNSAFSHFGYICFTYLQSSACYIARPSYLANKVGLNCSSRLKKYVSQSCLVKNRTNTWQIKSLLVISPPGPVVAYPGTEGINLTFPCFLYCFEQGASRFVPASFPSTIIYREKKNINACRRSCFVPRASSRRAQVRGIRTPKALTMRAAAPHQGPARTAGLRKQPRPSG